MKIWINHLTRMQRGYVCVAGVDVETGRHVRPVLGTGRLPTETLARLGGAFDMATVVDLGATEPVPQRPEVEDHEFSPKASKKVDSIAADRFWTMVQAQAQPTLRTIFGPELQGRRGGAATVPVDAGQASLGCLVPSGRPELYVKQRDNGQDQVRMKLSDSGGREVGSEWLAPPRIVRLGARIMGAMGGLVDRFKKSRVGKFYEKYTADRADEGAVLIAWQTVFSIFPLLIGGLALLGLVLRDEEARGSVIDAVAGAFPEQAGDLISFLEETREVGGLLGLVSLLGTLWTGSNLFGQMSVVFGRFYNAPERSFIWQRLMSFAMIAVFIVLITMSVLASGATHFIVDVADWLFGFPLEGIVRILATVLGTLLSLASATLMFLVLYRVVPNVPLSFRDVWKGALLAAVLLVLLNLLLPFYFQLFGGGFAAYATLGLFLILLFWFLLISRILVIGAVVNALVAGHGPAKEAAMPDTGADAQAKQGKDGQDGRRRGRPHRHEAAGATANGHGAAVPPGKRILWAAVSAGVTGLTLAAAERTASGVWRALSGGRPPRKGRSASARLTEAEANRHLKV